LIEELKCSDPDSVQETVLVEGVVYQQQFVEVSWKAFELISRLLHVEIAL
jgi:hypothetical protein